jgi:sugar phosphate isomerase/epimerase
MLLTLSTGSLRRRLLSSNGSGLTMLDLPDFAIRQLGLHGLNVPASMLAGWSLDDLDRFRDSADKAACPCLVLIEDVPLPLGDEASAVRSKAGDRVRRLAVAANRLGCSALAVHIEAADHDEAFDAVLAQIKELMPSVERLELNVLIAPHPGLTHSTERLTALIKRVGGFRIGSLPSFRAAAECGGGDPIESLRKLAPYAGAIEATIDTFTKKGEHKAYDLAACVAAVRSVGFVNTLAIDYTGDADPVPAIEMARDILQKAIDDTSE